MSPPDGSRSSGPPLGRGHRGRAGTVLRWWIPIRRSGLRAGSLFSRALVLVVGGWILAGCAYSLGPSSGVEPGSRSIAVMPFENETLEPRVTESLATALRSQLQQEGTYRLSRHREADVVLSGAIVSLYRREESFRPEDTRLLHDYRLEIVARVTAVERGTGRKLLDRDVEGHTTLRSQEDMPSAERQAMPLLTGNLARNITSMLVDGTW